MDALTFALVAAHVLAAVVWVGGTLFLALMGPSIRSGGDARTIESLRFAGLRFRIASWVAVVVLLATGLVMVARAGALTDPVALASERPALAAKVALVTLMVIVKAAHDFVVGPRAARLAKESEAGTERAPVWRRAMILGHANALLGVVVVSLAVLVAGGE